MLDISHKYPTLRTAAAEARLTLEAATLQAIREKRIPKGDPLEIARAAAVMAAKNTPAIIPYCHAIPVAYAGVEFDFGDASIQLRATVKAIASTGVEMEALTAATVAALTLYDMLKMLDDTMTIEGVKLISKRGGKSDFREDLERQLRAAVLVMSDSIAAGKKSDESGRMIVDRLKREGVDVKEYLVIPDDRGLIVERLCAFADTLKLDLVVTTGGTGFSPRDTTPEAMSLVIDREIPGIPEAVRAYGQARTPFSMLSRGRAGLRGQTLIVNLPGSRRGVAESLDCLLPALWHSFPMLWGRSGWSTHQGGGAK